MNRREFLQQSAALPLAATPLAALATAVPAPAPAPALVADPFEATLRRFATLIADVVAARPLRLFRLSNEPRDHDFLPAALAGSSLARAHHRAGGGFRSSEDHPLFEAVQNGSKELVQHAVRDCIVDARSHWILLRTWGGDAFRFLPAVGPLAPSQADRAQGSSSFVTFLWRTLKSPYEPLPPDQWRSDVASFCRSRDLPLEEAVAEFLSIPRPIWDPAARAPDSLWQPIVAQLQFHQRAVRPWSERIALGLNRWMHAHPHAFSQHWDRLLWGFDPWCSGGDLMPT